MSGDPTIYGQKQFQMPERGTISAIKVIKSSRKASEIKDVMDILAPLEFLLSDRQWQNFTILKFH